MHHRDVFTYLLEEKLLDRVVRHLDGCIFDIFNLTRTNRLLWQALSSDNDLWKPLYLDNDPLVTPQLRYVLLPAQQPSDCAFVLRVGAHPAALHSPPSNGPVKDILRA